MKGSMFIKFRLILLILLLVLFSTSLVMAKNYEQIDSITVEQIISNSIDIIPLGSSYQVNSVEASLYTVPQESYRQEILSLESDPEAIISPSKAVFNWHSPSSSPLRAELSFQVHTLSSVNPVNSKVNFPLKNIPSEVQVYLQTTSNIDTNEDIESLASSLAGDEDDLFMIEYKLADWVNKNVEYDLSTLASQANQKSSWVLENKYGVCDEITNLFISLNRVLGIPARFVSGVAYTESELFDENWGNHGWAEVYFPGTGWVPYDVTYQQFGFIDAAHIELEKGVDGTTSSAEYSSKGYDFSIQPKSIDFETTIISEGNELSPKTNLALSVQGSEVGFGSYNVIKLNVKNPHPYYLVERLMISQTSDLDLLSPSLQLVALAPKSTKTVYWLVKVNENLASGYDYTFPVSVSPSIGKESKTSFSVSEHADVYSKEYMEQFIQELYSLGVNLPISCSFNKNVLQGSKQEVVCSPTDEADLPLTICNGINCETISSSSEEVSFNLDTSKIGFQTITLSDKNSDKKLFLTYKINDEPKIIISDLVLPSEFTYAMQDSLVVSLKKESFASPSNIVLSLDGDLFSEEWSFDESFEQKDVEIVLTGSNLKKGLNAFDVTVSYDDNEGRTVSSTKTISTNLVGLTFSESVNVFLNTVNGKISKFVTNEIYHAKTPDEKDKVQNHLNLFVIVLVSVTALLFLSRIIKSFARN